MVDLPEDMMGFDRKKGNCKRTREELKDGKGFESEDSGHFVLTT